MKTQNKPIILIMYPDSSSDHILLFKTTCIFRKKKLK